MRVRKWAEGSGDMGKGDKHVLELGRLEAQQEVNTQGNSGTVLRMRGEGTSHIGPPSSRFGASKKGQALALDQCIRGLWLPISLGKESAEPWKTSLSLLPSLAPPTVGTEPGHSANEPVLMPTQYICEGVGDTLHP